MSKRFMTFGLVVLATLALAGSAFAQGVQTGTIRGTVTTPDGQAVPGVLVTAESPALQGQRTAVTGATGEYLIRGLTPGTYTLTYELEGMTTVQSQANVELGQVTPVNAQMQVKTQEETIVVTGELPSVLASSEVSTTYDFKEVNNLPIDRDPAAIATLAPGLTTNTPNGGQVTISGGFAYDNVFLIDGVDANDNLFGTSNPVYIEDAIADTQVLTSGISAEYGRFSGGVVNVITKSGGNEFTGTLRADLSNPKWRSKTPIEKDNGTELLNKTNEIYQGTLGGYLWKDHLWFFGAGRTLSVSDQQNLFLTGLPYQQTTDEDRYEVKLTGNIANRHQLQGQFTDRTQTQTRPSFAFSATEDTLRTRKDPSDLKVGRYNGVLTPSLFAELQYSEKTFTFKNSHFFTRLQDSPFLNFGDGPFIHYNRPYFDGSDPEDRNNHQGTGSLSWFLDTQSVGTHDLKIGAEDFTSFRTGGNSQSPTDYVFGAMPLFDSNGNLVLDSNGKAIPVWEPGSTILINFVPTRGAKIDIETQSAFVNDRWNLNDHWSFNIGARYEQVKSNATGNITTVDTSRLVPRLGATYDLHGDGKIRFDATYAEYSGKYSEAQFAGNTTVGNPLEIDLFYTGPAGQGLDFDPAFDLNNWQKFDASVPTANVVVAGNIKSPVVKEYTLSAGSEVGKGGYVKAVYTNRSYSSFVENFILKDEAECQSRFGTSCTTTVFLPQNLGGGEVGSFNNTFIDNSNEPTRDYEAVQLIGRYRLTDNWFVQGNYTYQIKNEGNFEGENTNQPGISSTFGNYPEAFFPSRHFPSGRLNDFQRHRVRLWSSYNLGLGRAGNLNFGGLLNYDSATTFSFVDTIGGFSPLQQAGLQGYLSSPGTTQDIFFGQRGAGSYNAATTVDASVNYTVPIYSRLELWVKADIFNLFNSDTLTSFQTNITSVCPTGVANGCGGAPVDQFGLPTTFTKDSSFGKPSNNASFVAPREYRLTVGFRF